jgi:putative heme-binding domain-containing protein
MKLKSLLASALLLLPLSLSAAPQWIWITNKAKDDEKATFKKTFTIEGEIKSATLFVVCDNGADALLNGKKVLENPDWTETSKADVKASLKAGENELRFDARNQGGSAALIAKLEIETADGKKTTVETGDGWQATPTGKDTWVPAVVMAPLGAGPWGEVFAANRPVRGGGKARANESTTATPAEEIAVLPGFKAELLYTVPKAEQGSWVSMTGDPKGRLLVGDQYGGLYCVTLPPVGSPDQAKVETLPVKIGGAHGLLYAFDSLYVMINEMSAPQNTGRTSGLWRLKDKGDGNFDEPQLLRKIAGGGEHGVHGLALSPDGKSIYFACGNHTKLPENYELSRPARAWREDHVVPRMWDAKGHARGVMAPGGYICKTDPEGKSVEVFCGGFRNQYDIAFNDAGELFTYDSDMEWDMGAPWYMPTRINHCVSGGDYGWRSGSGRWPAYYADSLPATVNIGPGSPTGVVSGTGAKFPAKYQHAVYAADWTYGTMYVIHSVPKGGTYESVKEEFVSGRPLPLTDVVIHPQDGAMYFAVGGRRTQSALYRVTYTGTESTAPAAPLAFTPEIKERRELEKLHEEGATQDAVAKAWPHLSSPDRFVRFAARVAIEKQPVQAWKDKALAEQNPQALIEASMALARMGAVGNPAAAAEAAPKAGPSSAAIAATAPEDVALQTALLAALDRIEFDALDLEHQIQLLRAYELVFTRLGKPTDEVCANLAEKFDSIYPHKDNYANRELAQLLVFLDSKRVAAKTLSLMATTKDDSEALASDDLLARNSGYAKAADEVHRSQPNRQQFIYMFTLRNAKAGWTKDLRDAYFSWFPRARQWKGGNSFNGFIENIRTEALANFVPDEERANLEAVSSQSETVAIANFVQPKGPGRAYTIDEVLKLAEGGLKNRNFENGKAMFTSTLCLTCHRFGGDGGGIGPDVTGAGSRYTLRDLMENIIEPSKVISDQYDSHQIEKKDGSLVMGRVVSEDNGDLMVMMNPFAPTTLTKIPAAEVKSKKTQAVSMMPPGLINTLNQDELLDLIAYILSAGNPKDARFAKP